MYNLPSVTLTASSPCTRSLAVGTAEAVELSLSASQEGAAPALDGWQTYTYSLQDLSTAGLDISAIDVVMVFPAWGTGDGAVYRIDNVVISAP